MSLRVLYSNKNWLHLMQYKFNISPNIYLKNPTRPILLSTHNLYLYRFLMEKTSINAEKSRIPVNENQTEKVEKVALLKRIKLEIVHYYNGFKLLFIDFSVAGKLIWNVLNGKELTRREHKQLLRTSSDLFRLLPFSIFIVIPFMEFLLPFALKLFPNMLPSTFQTSSSKEEQLKKKVRIKLEMAKFLHDALEEIATVQAKGGHYSSAAQEFGVFYNKIKKRGHEATNEEILKFSKLFKDELTLDNLSRSQLVALCRLLELQPFGPNNFLCFQLRMKLKRLQADDVRIHEEGLHTLTVAELQSANRERGMRSLGLSEEKLKFQLQQWLELSLSEQIPPSLLLLSRALYLPEDLPQAEKLKVTISSLSDRVAAEAQYHIGKEEGKVDNKTKLQIIKEEQLAIKMEEEEKERLKLAFKNENFKEGQTIKEDTVSVEEDMTIHKNELNEYQINKVKVEIEDLKEEMAEYQMNVVNNDEHVEDKISKKCKGADHLFKRVNKMVKNLDELINKLDKERIDHSMQNMNENLKDINDAIEALKEIQKFPEKERFKKLVTMLNDRDKSQDMSKTYANANKLVDLLTKENSTSSFSEKVKDIVHILQKEEMKSKRGNKV